MWGVGCGSLAHCDLISVSSSLTTVADTSNLITVDLIAKVSLGLSGTQPLP